MTENEKNDLSSYVIHIEPHQNGGLKEEKIHMVLDDLKVYKINVADFITD